MKQLGGTVARPAARWDTPRRASYAQERFWFLHQFDPGSSVLNLPAQFRLLGRLDGATLRRSLQEVVNRHEALRTTFAVLDGQLFQVLAPTLTVALPVVDLRHLPESERQGEAWKQATEQTQQPFDLARGPLLRAMLFRLGEEEHVLLFVLHHIIFDGWSMGVLAREASILYEAFSTGQSSPLPDLPIQYADFAERQRQLSERDRLPEELEYWKQELGGSFPQLTLPTDRQRPPVQTFRGGVESLTLSQQLSNALTAVSRREGVTLFMTLLAAFQALLHRYTGQHDVAVGVPVAERGSVELEGLIGCFLNILIFRTDLSGNPTFRELLQRVRSVTWQAWAHQALHFQKLVEELRPARDPSRPPLVQVFLNVLNYPHDQLTLPGVKIQGLPAPEAGSMHDMTLYA